MAKAGVAGTARAARDTLGVFPDYTAEVLEVRDLGDYAVAAFRAHAHGLESGTPVDEVLWHAAKASAGKVTWWRVFDSEAEALKAAGLSE